MTFNELARLHGMLKQMKETMRSYCPEAETMLLINLKRSTVLGGIGRVW
jgi:hypothetical protein